MNKRGLFSLVIAIAGIAWLLFFMESESVKAEQRWAALPEGVCDRFLKASDGEVIGILSVGKTNLSITQTIKEVTWTVNGNAIVLRWDGKNISFSGATNTISAIIDSGIACQSRGHRWELGCGMLGCLVNHAGPMRHCTVCGTTQTQDVGPWK